MLGYFFAILVAISYGTSSFYMKAGMKKAPGDVGVFYTVALNAGLALILSIFLLLENGFVFGWPGIGILVISGLLGPILGRSLLYSSIRTIGITRSATLKNAAPVFSAIIAYLILGETLTLSAVAGIGVVIFGLYRLTQEKKGNEQADAKSTELIKKGIIFGITSALCFATGNVFRKWGLQYIDSALLALAISTTGSLLFYLLYFSIKGKLKELKVEDGQARKNFIIGGLWTTVATFSYFTALKTIPVAVTVTLANTEPIFAILLGKYIFKEADEAISLSLVINIAIIFTGVLMITLL